MRVTRGQGFDPRLGLLDYSGYERAAATRAQGMQQLGQSIGEAIKGYKANRDEEKNKRAFADKIAKGKNSYMLEFLGFEADDVKDITADEVYGVIQEMNPKEVQTLDKTFFVLEKKEKAELAKARIEAEKDRFTVGDPAKVVKQINSRKDLEVKTVDGKRVIRDKKTKRILTLPELESMGISKMPGFQQAGFADYFNTGSSSGLQFLGYE
jgi:hypothetical protein